MTDMNRDFHLQAQRAESDGKFLLAEALWIKAMKETLYQNQFMEYRERAIAAGRTANERMQRINPQSLGAK